MDAQLKAGDIFDRKFRIERELGRGGFATVYLAQHVEIGHRVAIKLLHRGRSDERFVLEAKVLVQLRSPYTVRLLDFGRGEDGTPFIVCDYVDGTPLDRVVRSAGALAPDRAMQIVGQVLESLAEAHMLGVVHRDLKPANIFLSADGEVRVLDFGIAKLMPRSPVGRADHTNPGFALGTPSYMAPEQLVSAAVTPATDLFALGLIAWELLFGRRANDSQDVQRMLAQQFGRKYSFEGAPVSAEVRSFLESLVAQSVHRRPADGGAALARLRQAAGDSDGRKVHGAPIPPPREAPTSTPVATEENAPPPSFAAWPGGFAWAAGSRVMWATDGEGTAEAQTPSDFTITAVAPTAAGVAWVGSADGRAGRVRAAGPFVSVELGERLTAVTEGAAATRSGRLVRVDLDSLQVHPIADVSAGVDALAINRVGDTLAVVSGDTVRLRDLRTGAVRSATRFEEPVRSVVFSPDDYLLAILLDSELVVASAVTLDAMVRFKNTRGRIVAIRFTPLGQLQTAVLQGAELHIAAVD